jgi:DNA-binding MarR family transcriptional regulator
MQSRTSQDRPGRATRDRAGERRVAAIEELIEETRQLFHRLRATAEAMHGREGVTAGSRGVLMSLARGPQTVPTMARARPTSRQHIQALVNRLIEAGLVATAPNPAHRRSPLIALTRRGEARVATMRRREAQYLSRLEVQAIEGEILAAAAALRDLRGALARRAASTGRGRAGSRHNGGHGA